MPSVISAGTDEPRGTSARKMLWSSRSTSWVNSDGLLLCTAIDSLPVIVWVAGSRLA